MRKIRRSTNSTVDIKPKSERFNTKSIWAIGIILVMVLSAVGYYYADRQDFAPSYHGYRFKLDENQNNLLRWKGEWLPFTYHPSELERIALDPHIALILQNSPQVAIAFDANTTDAAQMDITRFRLGQLFAEKMGIAIGMGTLETNTLSLPVLSCANATSTLPVIELRVGTTDAPAFEGTCIRITGTDGADLEANGERLEYALLGVMA